MSELGSWILSRIFHGVAEHLQEDGLRKVVKAREGLAAFGAKRVCLIKDRDDAALLVEGRHGHWPAGEGRLSQVMDADASGPLRECARRRLMFEEVK